MFAQDIVDELLERQPGDRRRIPASMINELNPSDEEDDDDDDDDHSEFFIGLVTLIVVAMIQSKLL